MSSMLISATTSGHSHLLLCLVSLLRLITEQLQVHIRTCTLPSALCCLQSGAAAQPRADAVPEWRGNRGCQQRLLPVNGVPLVRPRRQGDFELEHPYTRAPLSPMMQAAASIQPCGGCRGENFMCLPLQALVSVSTLGTQPDLSDEQLAAAVQQELGRWWGAEQVGT